MSISLGQTIAGFLLGFSICVVLQSQIFLWEFGPLDGREIKWETWAIHGNIELIV